MQSCIDDVEEEGGHGHDDDYHHHDNSILILIMIITFGIGYSSTMIFTYNIHIIYICMHLGTVFHNVLDVASVLLTLLFCGIKK